MGAPAHAAPAKTGSGSVAITARTAAGKNGAGWHFCGTQIKDGANIKVAAGKTTHVKVIDCLCPFG